MKMQVNSSGLIKNLGVVFSDPLKVLSELIQNGRRAGATEIQVDYHRETETNPRVLVISDNGCGIQDFQKLLTVAESGWNDDIRHSEMPYGMGATAMLFACDAVDVESGSLKLSFSCADAIASKELGEPVETQEYVDGCKVTLYGYQDNILTVAKKIKELAKFSSVAIRFNGELLESDLSLNALKKEAQDSTTIFIDETEIGTFVYKLGRNRVAVVSQDLLVSDGDYVFMGVDQNVCPTLFASNAIKLRMPDRDQIVDEKATLANIHDVYKQVVERRLNIIRQEMNDDKAFIDTYFNVITYYCRKMLNDIDYLPVSAFVGANYPVRRDNHGSHLDREFWEFENDIDFVTPETQMQVFESSELGEFDESPLEYLFLWGKMAFEVIAPLDSEHWVYKKRINVHNQAFGIRVTNRSEPICIKTSFYQTTSHYQPGVQSPTPVYLVDEIELFLESDPDNAVNAPVGLLFEGMAFVFDNAKSYYVPVDYRHTSNSNTPWVDAFIPRKAISDEDALRSLLLMHNAYENEYDWDNEQLDKDVSNLMSQLEAIAGRSLPKIIERYLADMPDTVKERLSSKQFMLSFDKAGKLDIMEPS